MGTKRDLYYDFLDLANRSGFRIGLVEFRMDDGASLWLRPDGLGALQKQPNAPAVFKDGLNVTVRRDQRKKPISGPWKHMSALHDVQPVGAPKMRVRQKKTARRTPNPKAD